MGGPERKADDAVEEGLALFQQGKLDQAIEIWQEAQSLAPGHTRAQEYLGYVEANRDALEQRFRLAESLLFGGQPTEPPAPLADVPSRLQLPNVSGAEEVEEDDDEEDEPTVSMPVKVLADRLAQSRAEAAEPDYSEGDYLEVMEGGGEEMVDDFEPMEKTPVGVNIPDPVRLMATDGEDDTDDDGVYDWDEDTPSVREVGQQSAEPLGLTTGDELSLDDNADDIEELDDGDIVEEVIEEAGEEGVEVKYRSLAEFDAAYAGEYVEEEDLDDVEEVAESTEAMLELDEEPESDPHLKQTMKMQVAPEEEPVLELEPEPDDDGVLELVPPDSGEERELEVNLEQSFPGPSELLDLTPQPGLPAPQPEQAETSGMVILSNDEPEVEDLGEPAPDEDYAEIPELEPGLGRSDLLDLSPDDDHDDFLESAPEVEVQVNNTGQEISAPADSDPAFQSVEIDMDDSIDAPEDDDFGGLLVSEDDSDDEPDEVEFGGAMDFDDVGEVYDDVGEAFDDVGEAFDDVGEVEESGSSEAGSSEVAAESGDGFSWEEGSGDWDEAQAADNGLEVLVFERDDPTPTVDDPLMALPTMQDSYELHEGEEGHLHKAPPPEEPPEEDALAWAATEETSDAPEDFLDEGFEVEDEQTPRDPAPPQTGEPEEEPTLPLARDLLKRGELEDALTVCTAVCEADPNDVEAKRFLERIQQSLLKRYWADIGDLSHVPTVKVPHHEILWQDMDHRKGFLLSRIDGMLSFEDIIDISGMEDFEVCQILVRLKREGVIG